MPSQKIELVSWTTPNYVTMKVPPRPRQEGWSEAPKFHLGELDVDVLSEQCDRFRAEVFEKAGKPDPRAPAPEGAPARPQEPR